MYVLFIVLNEVEYLSEILNKMKALGIRGATVIESMGSASVLKKNMYDVSFIGGFVKSLEGDNQASRVIFSLIEREEQVNHAMNEVEKILHWDTQNKRGIMFVLPVDHFRGGELERHIESREDKKILNKEYENEYY